MNIRAQAGSPNGTKTSPDSVRRYLKGSSAGQEHASITMSYLKPETTSSIRKRLDLIKF